jgi:hypothetical protein
MLRLLNAGKWLVTLGLIGLLPAGASGQPILLAQGAEYPIAGKLPGDQVHAQVALSGSGGLVVWQDNFTDGDGLGISARRIDQSLSPTLSTFQVNQQAAGDQENAQVAFLGNGGAVFAWQGGPYGFQHIYARFMGPEGTFLTDDLLVNAYTDKQQVNPAVAVLHDGTVVVVWSSYGQDDANNPDLSLRPLQGVFGQRFSPSGTKLGGEFQINLTVRYNQRTPSVAGLADGRFVVAWVSEQYKGLVNNVDESGQVSEPAAGGQVFAVDIYARLFARDGTPLTGEFQINSGTNACANPSVVAGAEGGFIVAWSEDAGLVPGEGALQYKGWDVMSRGFDAAGRAKGPQVRVNVHTDGNQFGPKLAAVGANYLAVWTSVGQDGSREGIYARALTSDGSPTGEEFRANTTTISQQLLPSVASYGTARALVVWSSFGERTSFDIYGQRYVSDQPLLAPAPPFVSALSQSRLSVTWPEMAGYDVVRYELYVDDNPTPVNVVGNMYSLTQLAAGSTYTFRLAYRLADGRASPVSKAAAGTTWNEDDNFDGLPDDWQGRYWGSNVGNWPAVNEDSDGDGATNLQEFLAGTDPTSAESVLRTFITSTSQGWRLNWNTQPGLIYQVQTSTNASSWTNLGTPRFAAGETDAIPVEGGSEVSLYRVLRLR